MEVAILQPHDCLKRHHHHHHHRRQLISQVDKSRRNLNPNPNPNHNRSNRRRRNSPPPPNGPTKSQHTRPNSPPVLGQVRILKRGEEMSLPVVSPSPPSLPEMMPESELRFVTGPIIDGFYAGSAFVTSPPPSELPLPAFFTRRSCGGESHNNEIACELRRVLKLQL